MKHTAWTDRDFIYYINYALTKGRLTLNDDIRKYLPGSFSGLQYWSWDQYPRIDRGMPGFRSFCVISPLKKIEVLILSNQKDDSAGAGLYKIATGIYAVLKNK